MEATPFQKNNTYVGDGDCVVWSEEQPAIIWTQSTPEKNPSNIDSKLHLLEYYSSSPLHSNEEELPPKYESGYESGEKYQPHLVHSLLQTIRFIFVDHLWIKLIAIYLCVIYTTRPEHLFSPFGSSDWLSNQDWTRMHSRDFQNIQVSQLFEQDGGWSRSRLGRVGFPSPFLTVSELELVSEVEWEVEPSEETNAEDTFAFDSADENALLLSKAQSKLPLPFLRPSNLFNYSRQLFDQNRHRLPIDTVYLSSFPQRLSRLLRD